MFHLISISLIAASSHEKYIQNQLAHLQKASQGIQSIARSLPETEPSYEESSVPAYLRAAPADADRSAAAALAAQEVTQPKFFSRNEAVYPRSIKVGHAHHTSKSFVSLGATHLSTKWIIAICLAAVLVLAAVAYLAYEYSVWTPKSPTVRQSYRSLAKQQEAADEADQSPVNKLPIIASGSVSPDSSPAGEDRAGKKQSRYKSRKIPEEQVAVETEQPAAP